MRDRGCIHQECNVTCRHLLSAPPTPSRPSSLGYALMLALASASMHPAAPVSNLSTSRAVLQNLWTNRYVKYRSRCKDTRHDRREHVHFAALFQRAPLPHNAFASCQLAGHGTSRDVPRARHVCHGAHINTLVREPPQGTLLTKSPSRASNMRVQRQLGSKLIRGSRMPAGPAQSCPCMALRRRNTLAQKLHRACGGRQISELKFKRKAAKRLDQTFGTLWPCQDVPVTDCPATCTRTPAARSPRSKTP